jgi:hypothetical protein
MSSLNVSPTSGSSTGEQDSISLVDVNVSSLPIDIHSGMITVTDPGATNSPQTIAVTLNVTPQFRPGDFDLDTDVDLGDFAHFQRCMTASGVTQTDVACVNANFDQDPDGDVDTADLGLFLRCVSGAGVPSDPDCLE